MFAEICCPKLNSRQKENYNFAKAAARLADYGYSCLRLSDDWQGADFIAMHVDGVKYLRVQLKGRLTVNRIYHEKGIWIAFIDRRACSGMYVCRHDDFMNYFQKHLGEGVRQRFAQTGRGTYPPPPAMSN